MNSTNVHHFLLNHFPNTLWRKQNPTSEKDAGLDSKKMSYFFSNNSLYWIFISPKFFKE